MISIAFVKVPDYKKWDTVYKSSRQWYQNSSSLSTHSSSSTFGHLVDCFLLHLFLSTRILRDFGFLLRFHSLSLIFSSLDRLIPLRLSHFRFHVTLGQDGFQRCTLNGTLELDGSSGSLFGDFFSGTFLVLLSVQNSPRYFSWISLHQEGSFDFLAQEIEQLSINSDESFSMTWVDLVTTEITQFQLHCVRLFEFP